MLAVAAFWRVPAQDAERTTRDGVFTAEQAMRGQQLFESICMSCHDVGEFTAAGAYLDDVEGAPLWETYDYVSTEMPEDDPASLSPAEYADVLSYLFSVYGLPNGAVELPFDEASLEAIAVAKPGLRGS